MFTLAGMIRLLIIFCLFCIQYCSFSQVSDFITVKKKNGRLVKTFMVGVPIIYETISGVPVNGEIISIRNDSIFVKVVNVRTMRNDLGSLFRDTINTYIVQDHYKSIRKIMLFDRLYNRKNFGMEKVEQILYLGGAGYLVLNLFNGSFTNEKLTSKKNLGRLGISLGALGTGLFLRKIIRIENDFSSPRRHRIHYVNMNK